MHELDLVSQEQTVRRWVREGKLEGTKTANYVGYQITVESLEAFIKEKQLTALKRQRVYQKGFEDGYNKAEQLYKQLGLDLKKEE